MDENEERALKVRVSGDENLAEAVQRWSQATSPLREAAERFAELHQPRFELPEGFSDMLKWSDRSQSMISNVLEAFGPPAIPGPRIPANINDLEPLPNPFAEQAERDRATLDVLEAIRGHLQDAEDARRSQHRWDLGTRVATIIGALAAVAAAVLAGLAL